MWKQGSLVEIDLTDLATNGSAVGRFEGRVVFVPGGVPGDRIISRLVYVKSSYAHGKLTEIMNPSSQRVRPTCLIADKCGGCQWQQVSYPYQLKFKQKQVIDAFERIGGLQAQIEEVIESQPLGYRNRVIYPLGKSMDGKLKMGYYQKGTHKIVNLNCCPVEDPRIDFILPRIKSSLSQWEVYDERTQTGSLKHLSIRVGQNTDEILITLVSSSIRLKNLKNEAEKWMSEFPSLVGVCLNLNQGHSNTIFGSETKLITGRNFLQEYFCHLKLQISSTAFFQVNTQQAEKMVSLILELLELKGDEVILDGYSGIGTMILPIAKQFPNSSCWSINSHSESIQCAQQNAKNNNITNTTFKVGKLEKVLPSLNLCPDVIILDPPRKGCDQQILQSLLENQPKQIVYISCKPSTLARDLRILTESEFYQIQRVLPIDLFPQTSHIETITLLKQTH